MAASMKFSRAAAARPVVRAQAVKPQAVKIAQAAGLSLASFAVALSASAGQTIYNGGKNGELVFDPESVTVASGTTITFENRSAFPHNVVFDDDTVPAGVDADAISTEDYLNGAGDKHVITLKAPGKYVYKCEPHVAANMKGTIIVE